MKTILVPYDGSPYADRALEQGRKIADSFHGRIILLNVVRVFPPDMDYRAGLNITAFDKEQINANHRQDSHRIMADCMLKFTGSKNQPELVILEGDPADQIIQYLQSHPVDLVVMGSHGMGSLKHRILAGSVTTKVLHHTEKSVLIVK